MSSLLSSVSAVLSATPPIGDLSQAELDAKKTIIEATRTAISTKFTSVINQIQSITTAKNSYMTYNIAYEKSLRDLDNTKLQSQSLVEIKEASYNQAQANLDKIKASPREVDLAYYRATLSQAQANLSKAIMRAPIDGMVTKINKKAGELAMSNEVMVEILSPHFEIEVDIPETDIVKLAIGNKVEITLDAFGEDEKFLGSVVQIDPASTEIQDVVYYKVKIALDDGKEKVLSGMTANVLVSTEEKNDILYLPFRSVLSRNGSGEKYVRVLENGELKEINVTIGLRGDNGLVEILSGVEEGQEVVLKVIE
jgi:RND family efflux transporter MFP subunit